MPTLLRRCARYVAWIVPPVLAVALVLHQGAGLAPAGVPPSAGAGGGTSAVPDVLLLLAQVAVILAAARLTGLALRRVGQPQVVGEMLAGFLLGPSCLGVLAPSVSAALFDPASLGFLSALSQLGLLVFMFVVGLALDAEHLRTRAQAAVLASHAGIVAPFLLGVLVAPPLFARYGVAGTDFVSFALFLGSALSVTAFPVLARILAEKKLLGSRLGSLAMACAAIDDVTAWLLLAGVLVLVRADHAHGLPLWATLAGLTALVVTLAAGRRLLARLAERMQRTGRLTQDGMAVVLVVALGSAWVTEALGVHALFGAFLAGVAVPRVPVLIEGLRSRLEDVMVVLFVPLFFAFTGLRTQLGLVHGADAWLWCGVVFAVAVAGKLGGATVAARASGLPWRDALGLGVLMNTRGLMELVFLNVGLEVGILSPPLYAMLVLMALVTTGMTAPLLALVLRGARADRRC